VFAQVCKMSAVQVCPMLRLSITCALRIRYGMVSSMGPKGTYLYPCAADTGRLRTSAPLKKAAADAHHRRLVLTRGACPGARTL
jgi:hypothetical protein